MKNYQVVRTHLSPYQNEDFLQKERALVHSFNGLDYQEINNLSEQDTILITNTHTQLKNLPDKLLNKTKLIIHPNSGYDHFADEYQIWKKIPVIIGHSIRAQAVAEYHLACLFQGLLELPHHLIWDKKRSWNRSLLKETPAWIFGYGHIGKIIADTLHTLGLSITVVDPYVENCPHRLIKTWKHGPIKEAKVILVATSLNQTSYHMFNEDFFQQLGEKVLFINGARGQLVKEDELKKYLLNHSESYAFLDVFEKEPFDNAWTGFPQVWKTSHIAGVEKNLDHKILDFEYTVLNDFLHHDENHFFIKYEKELLQNKWIKGVLI
jgi:D-3-phosphoglycerate dehydrogenase